MNTTYETKDVRLPYETKDAPGTTTTWLGIGIPKSAASISRKAAAPLDEDRAFDEAWDRAVLMRQLEHILSAE